MIIPKSSFLYSIIWHKCPRCHEGDLWRSALIPHFKLYDMYEQCPVCKTYYETEPQVWYGAMIIAYIVSSVTLLLTAFITFVIFDMVPWQAYLIILSVAILGFAFNARLSRAIWINVMIRYDANVLRKQAEIKQKVAAGATVVDVRSKKEFALSHYGNSHNVPLYNLLEHLSEFKQMKQPIVVVCQSGNLATQAVEILHNNGIDDAQNGGGWRELT